MKTAISLSTISEESIASSKEIVVQTKLLFNSPLSKDSRTSINNQDISFNDSFRPSSVESDFNKEIDTPISDQQRSDSSFSHSSISSSFYHPNLLPQYRNLSTPVQSNQDDQHQSPPPNYTDTAQQHQTYQQQQNYQFPYFNLNNTFNINLQK